MKFSIISAAIFGGLVAASPMPTEHGDIEGRGEGLVKDLDARLAKRTIDPARRDLIPFKPTGPWNADQFYWRGYYFDDCDTSSSRTRHWGRDLKTTIDIEITKSGKTTYTNRRQRWWDDKDNWSERPGKFPGTCRLYGERAPGETAPKVADKYIGSASGGKKRWFDYYLQREVTRWFHTGLQHDVSQWETDDWVNYRFYDSNDFAWFVSCPHDDATQRKSKSKRNDGNRVPTKNPIWDFRTAANVSIYADQTPRSKFDMTILSDNYADPHQSVVGITYYKKGSVEVDGKDCWQMAVSRPGLLHWTATFYFDGKVPYFPSGSDGPYTPYGN